jgi:hypothetical protein
MSSGWNDAYLFHEDGTFVFEHNKMACDNRNLTDYGTWSLLGEEADTLRVLIGTRKKLVGGFKVRSDASCASDYKIEGGEIIIDTLERQEGMLMKLRDHRFDERFEKITLWIGGRQFWKFSDLPEDYYR